ncbi:hypothetical protein JRO89_XS11G0198200 [Xanthoceras sorbifolium]|uniref:Short-chain dehydrogenase TIC 32, chloroplastic n=1 Tax=Xanthoceras sorbifolium TaxID=99658 RepID=A0ABQ8HGA3_9ROSI|nr:hypothetical protein JRO89_XS11G0198200 [Xanthoceras sorbifolium]
MWFFGKKKGPSGFSSSSTAEEVTQGVDGAGLTAIVTGGSSGIGIETVRALALRGVHVIMAVRNVVAGNKVKEEILKKNPAAKIDVMELDLSSMASVRKFTSDFIARGLPLNILINNAGIMGTPFTLSKDNIELQFATNHIGHFLLTNLLLDTMKKTAKESGREGRIVIVASDGHKFTYREGIRFEKINDPSGYTGFSAYGQSKLANILHANELAKRLKEEGVNITVNSLHPGGIATNISRHNGVLNCKHAFHGLSFSLLKAVLSNTIGKFVTKSLEQGAATQCYLALNPQVQGVTGEYFEDCNMSKTTPHGRDTEMAKKLWDLSMEMTNK